MTRNLGKNSLWLLISRLGTQVLTVVFTVLLTRRLGSVGYGEYAFLAATIVIGNMLTTFGTDMFLMREIAAKGDFSHLPAALLLQLGLSALFVGFTFPVATLFPNLSASAVLAVKIYSLALFPLSFFTVFTSALRGMQRMQTYAMLSLATISMQVVVLVVLPVGDLVSLAAWLLIIQIFVTFLAGVFCSYLIPDFWHIWHISKRAVQTLFYASAPIALLAILGVLYQKLNIYMLSAFTGAAMTGWFSAALRAVEASKTVHISIFTALYPAMARSRSDSKDTFRSAWVLLLIGAALIAITLSLLAAPLVNLLFGLAFAPAIPALRILAWMLVPYTINTYLTLSFVANRREQNVVLALLASLLALIVMSLVWIPRFGLVGAAWAALAAEILQALMLLSLHVFQIEIDIWGRSHEFSKLS